MRLHKLHEEIEANEDYPLLNIMNYEHAWSIFSMLELTNWQWTINEILEQPESLLADVMEIAVMSAQVRHNIREQSK